MKLGRNLEINVGDVVRFDSGAMYLCIDSRGKLFSVLLNIIDNTVTSIARRSIHAVDSSSIEEIRSGNNNISDLIFNEYIPKYKSNLYDEDKLWTEIKKYTELKWSRKILNLKDELKVNDILIIYDKPYLVYTIHDTFLGSKEITITRLDKKKFVSFQLIDIFRYEDEIYRDDKNAIDIREVDEVIRMTEDFRKELPTTCVEIKAKFKQNDYLEQLSDTDKFTIIYNTME